MTTLPTLQVGDTAVVLREAVAADVPALVALLAADQLGATRDGATGPAELAPYLQAFAAIDADPAHLLVVGTVGCEGTGSTGSTDGTYGTYGTDSTGSADLVATLQLSFLPGMARRGAWRAQIEAVRVRADLRGRGLGAALFAGRSTRPAPATAAWCN